MNCEFEVKQIMREESHEIEKAADRICGFTYFKREHIIKAMNIGGKTSSDVYRTLINLNARLKKDGK